MVAGWFAAAWQRADHVPGLLGRGVVMTIHCETIAQMTEICARLVRQGIQFSCEINLSNGLWMIECTGGY
jgi:hypothetical protein